MSFPRHGCASKHCCSAYRISAAVHSALRRPVYGVDRSLTDKLKTGPASARTLTQFTINGDGLMPSSTDYEAVVAKAPGPDEAQWVFGYGSIVFRPGFTPGEKVSGCIRGWKRVMYQHSTDHRGVPGSPGRTATIIPKEGATTWGVAFKLPEDTEERREALKDLEWREKQYDLKVFTDIYDEDGKVLVPGALVYVATSDTSKNVNWGGPRSLPELAEQISQARGPSGPNHEYLFGMAQGLRDIGEHAHDDHVFQLEALVKQMLADKQPVSN